MRVARLLLLATFILGTPLPANAQSASNLYILNCWGCHGSHGEGIKGTAPPLINLGDFLKTPGGRAYVIQVPGVSLSSLNDAQIAMVMNWVLDNMSKDHLPRDFSPYTAEEVRRYRTTRLAELSRTRRELLDQLVTMNIRSSAD